MMEPAKPKSHFGKILLINFGVMLALHIGRVILAPDEGIYGLLFCLAGLNFMLFFVYLIGGKGDKLAFFLSALLVFLVGFSDCGAHFHLDVR